MKELGAILLMMLAVVILGNLWFHLVESLLERIRRRLRSGRKQPVWHPLPTQRESEECPSHEDT